MEKNKRMCMKKLFLCLLTVLLVSCGTRVQETETPVQNIPDTVYIEVPTLNEERIKELEADVEYWKAVADSIQTTIPYDTWIDGRRIEKIKYYISICEKNSKNKKFFYGWIRRTMSEE